MWERVSLYAVMNGRVLPGSIHLLYTVLYNKYVCMCKHGFLPVYITVFTSCVVFTLMVDLPLCANLCTCD